MPHKNPSQDQREPKRLATKTVVYLAIFVLLAIAIVPHISELKAGIKALGGADIWWVAVAGIGVISTYFAAAFTYVILAKAKLKYLRTVAVQVAASFANRLIPSGVGGLGLNVDYLIKNGHKAPEAASVTAVNSAAAFASYVILLFSALTISNTSPGSLLAGKAFPFWTAAVAVAILASVAIILWRWKSMRIKLVKLLRDSWQNILAYRSEPFRLLSAVIGASLVTIFYVTALYASAHAVGMPVTIIQTFVAYTIGTLVGAAVPTPGGLGGVEAGLYAGFVAFGHDASLTLSAIIIYRLMTFWLPILPGYVSFWFLQRSKSI